MHAQQLMTMWRDYFLLACTIAATLLGLLFVAVSVNAETILSGEHAWLKHLAQQAYQGYILVVLAGLLFLFPGRDWNQAAQVFGFIGLSGLAWSGYRAVRVFRHAHKFGWVRLVRRMLPAILSYAAMCAAALWMLRQAADTAMVLVGAALVTLLMTATATAWDLLVQVGQLKQAKRA